MGSLLRERLVEVGLGAGLSEVRVASAAPFERARSDIETRRSRGYFGRMQFTTARPDVSCDVTRTVPGARSLVVGAFGYWTPEPPPPAGVRFVGSVARFSWTDWYEGLRRGLRAVAEELVEAGFEARVLVDANELVDRAAAERAGIGWFGKNTNVLHPRLGSWVLLGSVVTDAELPPDPPSSGTCGTCERCLPACPTQAFVAPGVLDARRCISYLLQSSEDIPEALRTAVGGRVYGCDDCQDVCPPNRRAARKADGAPSAGAGVSLDAHVDLAWLLSASDAELLSRFGRFYIPKRQPRFLRRNALVALGNVGDHRAVPLVDPWMAADDPMLRRHAAWALGRLGGSGAVGALRAAAGREHDPSVSAEIARALSQASARPSSRPE